MHLCREQCGICDAKAPRVVVRRHYNTVVRTARLAMLAASLVKLRVGREIVCDALLAWRDAWLEEGSGEPLRPLAAVLSRKPLRARWQHSALHPGHQVKVQMPQPAPIIHTVHVVARASSLLSC